MERSIRQEPQSLDEQVIAFIAQELAVDHRRITVATDIANDLGVDGDDGADLMIAFSRRFGVDLSSFDASLYFGPEAAFNPFLLLLPSWWRKKRLLRPLLVSDLIDAGTTLKWSSPPGPGAISG